MTKREKNIQLDRKIKTWIPGIWWTERFGKYYAKFKDKLLGEFDTEDQAIKILTETIRGLPVSQIRKEDYIMKKIEAYETYKQTQQEMALNNL